MFDQLLAHPGVEELSVLRSSFGFMAFHGGSLEQETDGIAITVAERVDASVYAVVQPPGLRWHVPSRQIDPAHSPVLASFLDHVDVAVALHGFGRPDMFTTLLLGGGNRELARHVGHHLRVALPEYAVVDALHDIPRELRGMHPQNPVNRPRLGGVQLELPPRVRGLGPFWTAFRAASGPPSRTPHTESLIDALASAATTWPV